MTMYSWKNVVVGVFIIAFLIAVSLLVFFLNAKGSCPSGTFTCISGDKCVPQRSVCNFHPDCPDEDDEDPVFCADLHGSVSMVDTYINISLLNGWEFFNSRNTCDIAEYPTFCVCKYGSRIYCKEAGLYSIPQNISKTVTHLILANNSIHNVSNDSFRKYDLQMIHLEGNELTYLPPGVFKGQVHLEKLYVINNNLTIIEKGVLSNLPALSWLFLDNNQIETIYLKDFADLVSVRWINLSSNKLTLEDDEFPNMPKLQELFLNQNEIQVVDNDLFKNLKTLELLSLRGNKIVSIYEQAFTKLTILKELNLLDNRITRLDPDTFGTLSLVSKLYLGNNPFKNIAKEVFRNMINLRSLNMEGIEISNIDIGMFETLTNLESVYFKKYAYCSYAPDVPRCRPLSDGISSMSQLLYKPILRYSTWVICVATCIANLLVLWGRFIFRDENKSLSLVIRNLAVSDFFMGVYLLMIAIHDLKFRDTYNREAHHWITSWGCTVTGMIGMISSEVSVLLLLFMSIDRFLLIAIPFGRYGSLTVKETTLILIAIWGFGISLAIIPALEFYSSTRFYGVNGLCFPLHIDDPYFIGWEFSAIIFIGINASSLVIIGIVYIGMFISIWKTRNATTVPVKDFEFAVRFFFIVLTDTICWLPIIITKATAFLGTHVSADVYGWLIVFILPINSALNPLLYTFTTPKYRSHIYRVPISAIESSLNRAKTSGPGSADTASMQLANRSGPSSLRIVTNKF